MAGTRWVREGQGDTLKRFSSAVVLAAVLEGKKDEAKRALGAINEARVRAALKNVPTSLRLTGQPLFTTDFDRIVEAAEKVGYPVTPIESKILVWRPEGA